MFDLVGYCGLLVCFCCFISFFQQQTLLGIKVVLHALHLALQPSEQVSLLLPLLTGITSINRI